MDGPDLLDEGNEVMPRSEEIGPLLIELILINFHCVRIIVKPHFIGLKFMN